MSDEPTDDELASMDDRIVEMVRLLMLGNSMKSIAEHFDVSDRTVYRWKTSSLGKQLIARQRKEQVDRAHRAVSASAAHAAATLVEIARDNRARRVDRIRASEALLRLSGVGQLGAAVIDDDQAEARTSAADSLRARFGDLRASLVREAPESKPGELRAVKQA